MIVKPQLPPKAGYVEKVDADGNHYYAPTEETAKKEEVIDILKTMLGVNRYE